MSNKSITILARVEALEAGLQNLNDQLNTLTESVKESLGGIMQMIQGVVLASGEGFDSKVESIMRAKQKERVDAKAAQEKAQVEMLVGQGILVPTDKAEEDTLVIGRVLGENESVVSPRLQTEFVNLTPEAKENLKGKGVGFLWASTPGNKFEILEIYKIVLKDSKDN